MSDKSRAELEAIRPAVDYGGYGHVHLGMGRPLSFEQSEMFLARYRSMTTLKVRGCETLDAVSLCWRRSKRD